MTTPELSVVLLCYREGERIRDVVTVLIKLLEQAHIKYELILVANYDSLITDPTPALAQQLAREYPYIVAMTNLKTPGQRFGWDARIGLKQATGQVLALLEGDTQTPLETLIALYQKMREGNYDLAKVVRSKRYTDWWRWILSHGYNWLCGLFWPHLPDSDINGKPKLLTRQAYGQLTLHSDDWFIDTEIMLQARKNKWRCLSLPVSWQANQYRPSHVKGDTILEFIKNIIRSLVWYN